MLILRGGFDMIKKLLLGQIVALTAVSVSAKTLTVNCHKNNVQNLELVSEIANVNTPQEITSLSVNGEEISQFRDASVMPIYKSGHITMKIQHGNKFYNTIDFSLSNCNDDFEATGKAFVKEYVGGFAGTKSIEMSCTCSLK